MQPKSGDEPQTDPGEDIRETDYAADVAATESHAASAQFDPGTGARLRRAALIAAAVNIAFKFLLMGSLAQVGLALATSIGAWINLGLVVWFAKRAGHFGVDEQLQKSTLKLAVAGLVLAAALWLCEAPVAHLFDSMNRLRSVATLALIAAIGGVVYGGIVLALFGPAWLAAFRARRRG